MVEIVSQMANVGESYDAYVIELSGIYPLEDEISKALDENFERIGEYMGEDQAYIKSFSTEATEFFHEYVDISPGSVDYPALIIMANPPSELKANEQNVSRTFIDFFKELSQESDSNAILIELGHLESKSEVTQVLERILIHLEDEQFMTEISREEQKIRLKNIFREISAPAESAISIISLI